MEPYYELLLMDNGDFMNTQCTLEMNLGFNGVWVYSIYYKYIGFRNSLEQVLVVHAMYVYSISYPLSWNLGISLDSQPECTPVPLHISETVCLI